MSIGHYWKFIQPTFGNLPKSVFSLKALSTYLHSSIFVRSTTQPTFDLDIVSVTNLFVQRSMYEQIAKLEHTGVVYISFPQR